MTDAQVFSLESLESRCLLSVSFHGGVWTVRGDDGTGSGANQLDDSITIQPSADDSSMLELTINGQVVGTQNAADVRAIRIFGGRGDDNISLAGLSGGFRTFLCGGAGNDVITGSEGDDIIWGGRGDDTLSGGGGNDRIFGGAGNDTITGGAGNDWLYGGRGGDTLDGGADDDALVGGGGIDSLRDGVGSNRLYGSNRDTIYKYGDNDHVIGRRHSQTLIQVRPPVGGHATLQPDQSIEDMLIQQAVDQYQGLFGQAYFHKWDYPDYPVCCFDSEPSLTIQSGVVANAAADYSGTNIQVAGVDEADIVKTDGSHIYIVSGDQIVIVDASDPNNLQVSSRIDITGTAQDIYVADGRLTILSNNYQPPIYASPGLTSTAYVVYRPPLRGDWYYQSQLSVTVMNVSDPADSAKLESTTLDGYLVDSRMVGDQLYLVMQNDLNLPGPQVVTDDSGQQVYQSEDAYRQYLETVIPDRLPAWTTGDGTATGMITSGNTYIPENGQGDSFVSIVSYNTAGETPGPVSATNMQGSANLVYATTDSIYLLYNSYNWSGENPSRSTSIYKFGLSPDVSLLASGSVPGQVLGQYSVDEFDGTLRIATTDWTTTTTNSVYMLQQQDDQLNIVGSLTGLGEGENIKSVRFVGNRGYVVTFRQYDPLFVLDLSDPTNPVQAGELTMPGFSSYLQPLDETHIIGFGREVAPGANEPDGMKLSVFDVSDPANPVETSKYVLSGDWWSQYSAALSDPHAFSYFPESGLLCLPIDQYPGFYTNGFGEHTTGSFYMFDVSAGDIQPLGQIDHDYSALRSLRIGDYLYTVSATEVKSSPIASPADATDSLSFRDSPYQGPYYPGPIRIFPGPILFGQPVGVVALN